MKTNFLIFSMLVSLFILSSCKNNDNDDLLNNNNLTEGTFTAKIDGKKFEPTLPPTAVYTDVLGGRLFTLTGVALPGTGRHQVLSLFFTGQTLNLLEETYEVDGNCDYNEEFCAILGFQNGATGNEDDYYSAASGEEGTGLTINFTEVNLQAGGIARGTFSGRIYDEYHEEYYEVTDGKFNLDIVE